MKAEDLVAENVGRKVLIDSLNGFDNARATLRAWSRDFRTVYVTLDSTYGKFTQDKECGYCGGAGEVAESSARYRNCPACSGSGRTKDRGMLLRPGMLIEIGVENLRFADVDTDGIAETGA